MIVMQGTLGELDLASLAVVTSLGRTRLRLEVTDPAGAPVGQLVLKAGRVVSASGGGVRGRDALSLIMSSATSSRFRLVREPVDDQPTSTVAMVDELAELRRPRPAPRAAEPVAPRVRMLEGRVDEFELPTVIQTIGMGRSCVELDVQDAAGGLLGSVRIKAGKIVSARARELEGIAAFSALLRSPACHYFVAFRVDADPDQLSALGSVAQLVLGALDAPCEAIASEPTSPAPAVPDDGALGTLAAPRSAGRARRLPRILLPTLVVLGGIVVVLILRTSSAPPAAPRPTSASKVQAATDEAPAAHAPPTPAPATPAAVVAPDPAPTTPPEREPPKASLDTAQAMLKQLGFDPGPIDNVYGARTRRALLRFQRKRSLAPTGVLDDATWRTIIGQVATLR